MSDADDGPSRRQNIAQQAEDRHGASTGSASTASESNPEKDELSKIATHRSLPISDAQAAEKMTTMASKTSRDPRFEVDWHQGDPANPQNWPTWYKGLVTFAVSFSTLVVVLYSTSYTSGISAMQEEFAVASKAVVTLGLTTYLFGLAVGTLFLAPISETYGRRPVYCLSMTIFSLLVIPCALAGSLAQIIILRFFGALAGSSMIANAPGTIGDMVSDEYRALAFSIWSIGPLNGPVLGPIMGGFVTEYLGWRWANWIVLMLGAVATGLMCLIKETYPPTLLQRETRRQRKAQGEATYWCRYDQRMRFRDLMKVNLSRPFVMAVTEPICIFWNVYISIIYGLLYLCFVAYPFVFERIRGWSLGFSGLAFSGIGIGSLITIGCEPLIRGMINRHRPEPGCDRPPPEAGMSIVCIAAILCPLGELWFAWTCSPATIHWAAPIAAGIPFGAGNTAVFIYAANYLVHSYGIYAASAMAGNAVVRSILGGTLPLAGDALYEALGANWAGTMLGLLEVIIIPIPLVFYRYGVRIRNKSGLIGRMREDQDRNQRKRDRGKAASVESRCAKEDV